MEKKVQVKKWWRHGAAKEVRILCELRSADINPDKNPQWFNFKPISDAIQCLFNEADNVYLRDERFYESVARCWLLAMESFLFPIGIIGNIEVRGCLSIAHLGDLEYTVRSAGKSLVSRVGSLFQLNLSTTADGQLIHPNFEFILLPHFGYDWQSDGLVKAADLIEAYLNFCWFRGW